MKQQLAAIAFNERELEAYVSQLQSLNFETVSEVKKAEDGTFYRVMAKAARQEISQTKAAPVLENAAQEA